MRWYHAVMSTVWLTAGTGCPHDHMRDGFIDRAARKDTKETLEQEQDCPPGQVLKWQCAKTEGDERQECKWVCK